jgi:hypothetical protein
MLSVFGFEVVEVVGVEPPNLHHRRAADEVEDAGSGQVKRW